IERLGPAIASKSPPTKRDLAACSDRIPTAIYERAKTGFTTPVRQWIADRESDRPRGLRGWAGRVHQRFRGDTEFPLRDAASDKAGHARANASDRWLRRLRRYIAFQS